MSGDYVAKLDGYRSWLWALAALAAARGGGDPVALYERWCRTHGVAR